MNEFGVFGMGTMGQNLALNIAERGFRVSAYNRPDKFQARIWEALERAKFEGSKEGKSMIIEAYTSLPDFVGSLTSPRRILLSIPSGRPVDDTLEALAQLLSKGDVIIDSGNEHFIETERRSKIMWEKYQIHHMGMGVSGGEYGARNGPSLMPGGTKESWQSVSNVLLAIAAKAGPNNESCVKWVGPGGSGHYVKMVHNGIEYADMQLIAEAYDFMRHIYDMGNIEIAAVFSNWNKGRLRSYLFEITSDILIKEDDQQSSGFLLDSILDQSGQKGTGKWTVQEAANIGMAVPSISAALEARFTSARKAERVICEKVYSRVFPPISVRGHIGATAKNAALEALEQALYASKILAYAQGFTLIKAASDEFKWNICLSDLALIWRGGCIIRADLLNGISTAFKQVPDSPSLLFDSSFADELCIAQKGLRQVVLEAVGKGLAMPGLASSLSYFDSMRRSRCPANMIQAQRDYFGAHTFKRTDKDGSFHATWSKPNSKL